MKTLVAVLLLASMSAASAEDVYKYYDNRGIYQGDTKRDGNRWVEHNAMGITQGWSQRDGNEVKHYNSMGIYQGSTKMR